MKTKNREDDRWQCPDCGSTEYAETSVDTEVVVILPDRTRVAEAVTVPTVVCGGCGKSFIGEEGVAAKTAAICRAAGLPPPEKGQLALHWPIERTTP